MKHPVFYIHGGPGLNSFAERALLGPGFRERAIESYFWDEPSKLRPDGKHAELPRTFQGLLAALEESFLEFVERHGKAQLVGHSFGANGAVVLARKYPERVSRLLLIAPSLHVRETLRNILNLAASDFANSDPERAATIEKCLELSQDTFDPPMVEGSQLAFQDPALFSHYWQNTARLAAWAECVSSSEGQMDVDSFFGVLSTWTPAHLESVEPAHQFPVTLLFGEKDPVVSAEKEKALARKLFADVRHVDLEGTGHFVHLEKPGEFFDSCFGKIAGA